MTTHLMAIVLQLMLGYGSCYTRSALMAGTGPSDAGALSLWGKFSSDDKGHCMTADDRGNIWVCSWKPARLLRYADPYPAGAP